MAVDFTDFDRIVTKDRPPLGPGAVSGSPSDNSGNPTVGVDFSNVTGAPDLHAIEALTGTGIAVRTAADTWALRSLTAPAAGLTITNPAGTAGNPTFGLANDLAALEALSTTGYAKRTGTDAWSLSSTVPWSDIGSTPTTLSGYGIVDAQPLDGDLTALAALTGTNTLYYRSAASTWSPVTFGSGISFSGGTLSSAGGAPGGSTTQVQFNDGGAFGGDSGLAYDKTTGHLTVTGTSGSYPQPLTVQANATNGVEFAFNNSNSGGTKKTQLSFYSQNNLQWAFGNDSPENGTDDFWIYQASVSDFRFQIKSTGLFRWKAYGAGIVQTDVNGNVISSDAVAKVLAIGGATPSAGTSGPTLWASGGLPILSWVEAGAAAGSKVWDFLASGGVLSIRAVNDAYSGASSIINLTHAGGIEFALLTLTTGLSIAVATKTFPLTINGTTVNVLCQ